MPHLAREALAKPAKPTCYIFALLRTRRLYTLGDAKKGKPHERQFKGPGTRFEWPGNFRKFRIGYRVSDCSICCARLCSLLLPRKPSPHSPNDSRESGRASNGCEADPPKALGIFKSVARTGANYGRCRQRASGSTVCCQAENRLKTGREGGARERKCW